MYHRSSSQGLLICALFVICALSGCATSTSASFRYVVTGTGTSTASGPQAEAVYNQPQESSEGSVRVRSMGIVDLRRKGEEARIPSLHIRTTLSKTTGDGTWKFNFQEQFVTLANGARSAPLYGNTDGNTDAGGLPIIEVKTGESRNVDLFFPLPKGAGSGEGLSSFDFKWLVRSGEKTLSQSTAFARAPQSGMYHSYPYYYDPYPLGYGSFWWGAGWGWHHHYYPGTGAPSMRIRK